jgi:hypothetical protein
LKDFKDAALSASHCHRGWQKANEIGLLPSAARLVPNDKECMTDPRLENGVLSLPAQVNIRNLVVLPQAQEI